MTLFSSHVVSVAAPLSSSSHLLHESFSQTHHLGEEDGVVGEVGAQVAQHAERVPAQVLEGLGGSRGPFVPQWVQDTPPRTFGETSPEKQEDTTSTFNVFKICLCLFMSFYFETQL